MGKGSGLGQSTITFSAVVAKGYRPYRIVRHLTAYTSLWHSIAESRFYVLMCRPRHIIMKLWQAECTEMKSKKIVRKCFHEQFSNLFVVRNSTQAHLGAYYCIFDTRYLVNESRASVVRMGRVLSFMLVLGRVGLGHFSCWSGWAGSRKLD